MTGHMCWCGRRDLSRFDEQYLECNCRTLVRASPPAGPLDEVLDEDTDLYGRNYWFERQQELGLPDLDTRARTDLHDRCVHWLAIVLGYVRPPARVLEIGTGHGAFLKLLTECGYVTTGVELSPCVAKYARARSGAPVLAGPLSHHHLAAKSFDLIVAFDVLEHLPDPLSALDGWTRLLRKDALLIVQTPCRPVELGPEDLALSRFGSMLIPEHLHLFTESSARELLRRAGLPCVTAEPPVFETDMILVASRTPMRANASISAADGLPPLVSTLVSVHAAAAAERQALRQELAGLDQQYQQANRDRTDRLARIHQLEREFARADEDRTARLNLLEQCEAELRDLHGLQRENAREIERLSAALAQADTDRVQRLERIHLLEEQYAQADRDRTARLADLEATNRHHEQQVRDLEARSAQREYLQREATAGEIERLNAELAQADTDRVQRLARIHVLEDLNAQADRDRLQHQEQTVREIERLGAALAQADADRVQRLERIHLLEGLYAQADRDRIARLADLDTTKLRHEQQVRDLETRTAEREHLHRQEHAHDIERLSGALAQADSERVHQLQRIRLLEDQYAQADRDRTARLADLEARTAQLQRLQSVLEERARSITRLEEDKRAISDTLHSLRALAADHQNSRVYKALVRVGRWQRFHAELTPLLQETGSRGFPADRHVSEAQWNVAELTSPSAQGAIAVDLTAILAGGENGGAKLVSLSIVQELARLAPERQWLLLTSSASHHEVAGLEAPNVRRHRVDPSTSTLAELLEETAVAALFSPMTASAFDDPRVPLVCLLHDAQVLTYPEFFTDADRERRRAALAHVISSADCVITPSSYTREVLLRHSTIEPGRVRTIPHAFAAERLPVPAGTEIEDVLERHGLERERYFVYPANFWPHKNHLMLLVAFGQLCDRRPDLRLRLVLTGSSRPEPRVVQEAAARMGLEDRVRFAGFVPDAELSALLRGAIAVVFPSLYEGFGMPLVEAFAARCAVACANVTSLPEIGGDAALAFDPRKPAEIAAVMERLATDLPLTAELKDRGAARLRSLGSVPVMAAHYLAAIEAVVGTPRRPRDLVASVFSDGWSNATLVVSHAGGAAELQMRLENPRDVPVTLAAPGVDAVIVAPGSGLWLRCMLPPTAGNLVVSISPTFRPADHGDSNDIRQLGIKVLSVRMIRDRTAPVELLPGAARV